MIKTRGICIGGVRLFVCLFENKTKVMGEFC